MPGFEGKLIKGIGKNLLKQTSSDIVSYSEKYGSHLGAALKEKKHKKSGYSLLQENSESQQCTPSSPDSKTSSKWLALRPPKFTGSDEYAQKKRKQSVDGSGSPMEFKEALELNQNESPFPTKNNYFVYKDSINPLKSTFKPIPKTSAAYNSLQGGYLHSNLPVNQPNSHYHHSSDVYQSPSQSVILPSRLQSPQHPTPFQSFTYNQGDYIPVHRSTTQNYSPNPQQLQLYRADSKPRAYQDPNLLQRGQKWPYHQ